MLRVITLNTLVDLSDWDLRGQVIVKTLTDLQPDLIAFQEVVLPLNTAQWVADQLEGYQVYITPGAGLMGNNEALAILTRLQVLNLNVLDLKYQNRKAQVLTMLKDQQVFLYVNTHLQWQEEPAPQRLEQAQIITARLAQYPRRVPRIIAGDFNTHPGSATYLHLLEKYASAYVKTHGREPDKTFPSPLNRQALRTDPGNQYHHFLNKDDAAATLDYIFVSPGIQVMKCEVVFDTPHPDFAHIYASDHFGLMADLKL